MSLCDVLTKCGLTKLFTCELVDPILTGDTGLQRLLILFHTHRFYKLQRRARTQRKKKLCSLLLGRFNSAVVASEQKLMSEKDRQRSDSADCLLRCHRTNRRTSPLTEEYEESHRDLVTFEIDPTHTLYKSLRFCVAPEEEGEEKKKNCRVLPLCYCFIETKD